MPEIESPDKSKLGKPVPKARKVKFQVFTAEEMAAIISHLPETARSRKMRGLPYPLRARFIVAWETALRPQTLNQLRAPDDYQPGAAALTIRDEADKNRFGRDLPLSEPARAALDSVSAEPGVMFGDHDYRPALRKAARAAGIDELRASRLSDYDFRHSRLTHLGQVTDNLSGVMFIAGHLQPATTARYMRPQRAAAEEVLQAAAAAAGKARRGRASTGRISGATGSFRAQTQSAPDMPARVARRKGQAAASKKTGNIGRSVPVRGGGLEPPWLLTASTSS